MNQRTQNKIAKIVQASIQTELERIRVNRISTLKKYNLTLEQWDSLFAKQGNACAICRTTYSQGSGWATDHNHETGKVRGILCSQCNSGIGMLKDDPMRCRAAAEYLEKNH